jgi:hypothetical protein
MPAASRHTRLRRCRPRRHPFNRGCRLITLWLREGGSSGSGILPVILVDTRNWGSQRHCREWRPRRLT